MLWEVDFSLHPWIFIGKKYENINKSKAQKSDRQTNIGIPSFKLYKALLLRRIISVQTVNDILINRQTHTYRYPVTSKYTSHFTPSLQGMAG